MAIDERDRSRSVLPGQMSLVFAGHFGIDDLVSFDQGQGRVCAGLRFRMIGRPHIVGIRQPEIFVESVMGRQELPMMAEVPFTSHARRIATRPEHLGHGCLAVGDAVLRTGTECAVNAEPVGITAREQCRPRRRTDRLRHVEISEPRSFAGESIEVGCRETARAEAADVGVALVVREDDNDIGQPVRGGHRGARDDQRREDQQAETSTVHLEPLRGPVRGFLGVRDASCWPT